VIIIIGILLAIAVRPTSGSAIVRSRGKGQPACGAASAEPFARQRRIPADATVLAIDSGVSPSLAVASAAAASFCLTDTVSGKTWSVLGPGPSSADYKNNATCA
jgi:hypothetical protein